MPRIEPLLQWRPRQRPSDASTACWKVPLHFQTEVLFGPPKVVSQGRGGKPVRSLSDEVRLRCNKRRSDRSSFREGTVATGVVCQSSVNTRALHRRPHLQRGQERAACGRTARPSSRRRQMGGDLCR